MKTFDELWAWVVNRLNTQSIVTVQDKTELEHVYNLMKDCDCQSYLEVGAAEGNSLYVLGHATKMAAIIDLGEDHTKAPRNEAIAELGIPVQQFMGDSTYRTTFENITSRHDCVLIDGGHDYTTVLSDAILYAPLANKYIFFHDIQLTEVRAAVEWFVKRWNLGRYSTFINSEHFGYAIIEVGKYD